MNHKQLKKWPCPKCAFKGVQNQVIMKQINFNDAMYICEGENCLYPLEALKKFPIVKREAGSLPVTKELLETLCLPPSLINEPELSVSHLTDLVELNSLKSHMKIIQETKQAWESFVDRMASENQPIPCEFVTYSDSDLIKLENIHPSLLPFTRHIFPDFDKKS